MHLRALWRNGSCPHVMTTPPEHIRAMLKRQQQLRSLLHRQALDVQAVVRLEARLVAAQRETADQLRSLEAEMEVLRREEDRG